MKAKKSRIFGIDLGTTYSSIAYIDDHAQPVIIPNSENQPITPSVVFFDENNIVVGHIAKESGKAYPDQVVSFIKRNMGEPDFYFNYNNRSYRPEEICSFILRKIVQDAEKLLNEPISNVVITCPAYFGINEREATQRAGEIAGLNVCQIINEPTAAAITYASMRASEKQVVLVYDLGGGTFDITLIDIGTDYIDVICTGGDQGLGGKDWDDRIVGHLVQAFQNQTNITENILKDPDTRQDLQISVENAKKALGQRQTTSVRITHGGKRCKLELSRKKFDTLTQPLLDQTVASTHEMLIEAKKKGFDGFDRIILVGGSTRMPQVATHLEQEFSIKPEIFDPDGAVAKGAAIFGWKLALNMGIRKRNEGTKSVKDPVIEEEDNDEVKNLIARVEADSDDSEPDDVDSQATEEEGFSIPYVEDTLLDVKDVASKSFGIVVMNDAQKKEIVFNVIKKNTTVPVDVVKTFPAGGDTQSTVQLRIMENSISEKTAPIESSTEIGIAVLKLPAGLIKKPKIAVHFKLSNDGRLQISAEDTANSQAVDVEIKTSSVIQGEELEAAIARGDDIIVE